MERRGADTLAWYAENAGRFFDDTVAVDLTPLHERFLALVPAGGHILDAGCGSGRDSRVFMDRGYRVSAFDASPELAGLASRHLGRPVATRTFHDVDEVARYDGIWACASLLHLAAAATPDRTDQSDILSLCDDNLVFTYSLFAGIEAGLRAVVQGQGEEAAVQNLSAVVST